MGDYAFKVATDCNADIHIHIDVKYTDLRTVLYGQIIGF